MLNKAYEMSYQSGLVRNSILDEFMTYHDIKQITGGYNHTFILKNDGSLWSCGLNNNGRLGLGDTTNRNTFTQVTTNINNDVKQIACGGTYTFILKNDGSLWSCGENKYGNLGLGDTTNKTTFTQVTTNINNDVKEVVCGDYTTFIIKNDGSVWSCGYNGEGELGIGNTTNKYTFTKVTTNINNDVKQIACGHYHTYMLKNDGSVWSCGWNTYGQLGLGNTTDRNVFTQVTTNINNDVKEVVCGINYAFILKNDGSVWSCGQNNNGQLGIDSNTINNTSFTKITTNVNNDVKQIVCGELHTIIIKNNGSLWSCGRNGHGQLGLGTSDENAHSTFTKITTNINNDVKQIVCGYQYTFIIKNDGSVWCCGRNEYGQLGLGDTTNRNTFVAHNFSNVKKIVFDGNDEVLVMKSDGSIYDGSGCKMMGYQVACGHSHTYILKNDGSVWSCGRNDFGQLGLGDTTDRTKFTKVTTNINNDVKQIACGENYTFILKNDGSVYSCGRNFYGQLGLNDNTDRNTFTKVTNDVKQIACGAYHTFILKNDGSVWSCGWNEYGQLGLGTTDSNTDAHKSFTKVATNINNDVKQIACGHSHTFIIKNDGSVWGCGYNGRGQLGLSNTTDKTTFTQTNSYVLTTDINDKNILSYSNRYIINIPNEVCVNEIMKACDIGLNHALFINNSNNLVMYATSNDYGQAGKNTELNTFVNHPSLTDVKLIACGDYSSYVYTHNDELYVFGKNDVGQLGLGGTDNESEPILIPNITGVKKMIAQGSTCIILLNDGTLLGVGENSQGQFGLGDSNPRNIFTQIAVNVEDFWYNQRTLVYYSDNFVYGIGNNNCNKLCAGTDVSVVERPIKLLYTPGMKTVAIGNNKLILVLASNSTPIVNYVSKAIPNFEFLLYDEDLVSCEVYLNDELLRTINDELTTQTQIVVIPEEDIVTGTNNIKIIVEDSDGNVATSITRFDKNPLNIEEGCSLIYKGKKYVVTGVNVNGDNTDLQLNKVLDIAAVEGDNLRIFNDNIEVKCECDGSGNNIDMELVGIQETNRNTIKETYELEVDCRTFAPNIKINKSTGSTKISRISVNCTYKED